ncbi:MFS transporter [Gluconobacter japonicus]|uniref:MFS transporter n=1 Tax=Gluconobacter japonicus TaxID=376620 RepID=UPI000785708B|nr:MFS transporter [Gluconobacter japonicus]KXV22854.1 MFS transporter [Gluconobacter japonicus]
MSSIAERLEDLPFSRFHLRLLVIGGLGYASEAADAGVVAFLMPVLRVQWGLDSVQTGILGASTYVGFLIGALVAGALGDRCGRRSIMMWALFLFCGASLASALIDNWYAFLSLRVVGGVGMGAEGAIVAPFLSEFVAARYRGAFTAALAGFFSFGFVSAALLGYFIIPTWPFGWRIVLIVLACPVAMLLWWRRSLPESPRWLDNCGRRAEAEAITSWVEASVNQKFQIPIPVMHRAPRHSLVQNRLSLIHAQRRLWARDLRRLTVMSWCLWLSVTFSSYAFFTWMPSLLVQNGSTLSQSFSYSIYIYLAQVPGYFSSAYCCERFGRKRTIVSYMFLAAISAITLVFVHGTGVILVASILLSFFMNGVNAGEYAYTPEIFPTEVRATGMGAASAVGRIGAIAAPIIVGYVFPIGGFAGVFGITTCMLMLGALVVAWLGIETKGLSLESIINRENSNSHTDTALTMEVI